jgi:hypothetical protein
MRFFLIHLVLIMSVLSHAQVFMRPFGNAASLASGGAAIAYPGLESGLHNDAQLGAASKAGLNATAALPYGLKDWKTGEGLAYAPIGKNNAFGLDLAFAGAGSYKEQRCRAGFGKRLSDKLMLGISTDLLHVGAQGYGAATAVVPGLGLLAQPLPGIWIGAAVRNPLRQKIGGYNLPVVMRLGACWKPNDLFLLQGEVEKDVDQPPQTKSGFVYKPGNLLTIRAGFHSAPAGMCFGVGLRLKNTLCLDWGSEWHPALGVTTAVMITWNRL